MTSDWSAHVTSRYRRGGGGRRGGRGLRRGRGGVARQFGGAQEARRRGGQDAVAGSVGFIRRKEATCG
jgi:hypothetical protein